MRFGRQLVMLLALLFLLVPLPSLAQGSPQELEIARLISIAIDPRASIGDQEAALGSLAKIGPPAVPALIQTLRNKDYRVRSSAAKVLGKIGPSAKEAVSALIQALRDIDAEVRVAAAKALGEMNPPADVAVPSLIRALGDNNNWVRANAASALGNIGPAAEAAVPALAKALRDSETQVRSEAANALGRIGLSTLIQTLGDNDYRVKDAVSRALMRIGKPAVPALIQALRDKDPDVRANAAWNLGEMGPLAQEAIPALVVAFRDNEIAARREAARVLLKIIKPEQGLSKVPLQQKIAQLKNLETFFQDLPEKELLDLLIRDTQNQTKWQWRDWFVYVGLPLVVVTLIVTWLYNSYRNHKKIIQAQLLEQREIIVQKKQLEAQLQQQIEIISQKEQLENRLQQQIEIMGDEVVEVDKKILAREEKARLDFARNLVSTITLETLSIQNHTFFADSTWAIQPQINVLLGKNGYGKSHLIRTVVSLLQNDPKTYELFGPADDKAHFSVALRRDDEPVTLHASKEILRNPIGKVPLLAIPDSRFINKSRTFIAPPDDDSCGLKEHGARHFLQEWPYEPMIQSFLYELCITYLKEGPTFNLPIFRLIQQVVNKLTDKSFAFHQIEPVVGEAKFRIEVITEGNERQPLPIQKASQGTLSVVAMFGLIYNYLRALWSDSDGNSIFQKPAIVCIDEIDAHLHPSWQQKFVKLLRETFPNIQFILTAHSPVIAAGCLENEVAVLRKTEGGFAVEQIREHLLGAEVGDLYKRLFEIDDVDENYLYYLTQYTLAASHSARIDKLESKPARTSAEEQELAHLHQQVRYIGEVAEIKNRKESDDTTEQIATLEAEMRALKSRLRQALPGENHE